MRQDKPSRTAYKVALNVVTLGAKPGMDRFFPPGTVQATEKLLVASGAAEARTVRWSRSQRMIAVYEAFDWMLPGQFEAFAHRKAFCERQVRDGIGCWRYPNPCSGGRLRHDGVAVGAGVLWGELF